MTVSVSGTTLFADRYPYKSHKTGRSVLTAYTQKLKVLDAFFSQFRANDYRVSSIVRVGTTAKSGTGDAETDTDSPNRHWATGNNQMQLLLLGPRLSLRPCRAPYPTTAAAESGSYYYRPTRGHVGSLLVPSPGVRVPASILEPSAQALKLKIEAFVFPDLYIESSPRNREQLRCSRIFFHRHYYRPRTQPPPLPQRPTDKQFLASVIVGLGQVHHWDTCCTVDARTSRG
jgi:hypothetical protein